MRNFEEFTYNRPDVEGVLASLQEIQDIFQTTTDEFVAEEAFLKLENISRELDTYSNIAYIKFSVEMEDPFNKAEKDFWNEASPVFGNAFSKVQEALLSSKVVDALKEKYPEMYFKLATYQIKLADERLIPLQIEENKLSMAYEELIGSAQISFDGGIHTLPEMGKYSTNVDRVVRKSAQLATTKFFTDHEEEFDQIYQDLVKNRTEQAKILGFKNYTEMSYFVRQRIGYGQKDVENYRRQILETVVPLSVKMRKRQEDLVGIHPLQSYDLEYAFPDGNASPFGTTEEKVSAAKNMYRELSVETGEFFDNMVEHHLLDLESKKGKQSGGYCTSILNERAPFIFANFNGTSDDIDVLTHEAGHAFQVWSSMDVPLASALVWPTIEAAEIFSMSMEFITWPWMENFFGNQTEKYKYTHLLRGVHFLPYGVLVDHFQHEVYENPDWTPKDRKDAWRRLEKMYLPEVRYDDNADLERGIFWYKQGHIFEAPFYYIDYTLAQIVAFQNWKKFIVDKNPNAWADYHRVAKFGGTKDFTELVNQMHLRSPFETGALEETIQAIETYLLQIDTKKL
ncbi:MAG: M3 family oligoendopeptidase [Streptococcaceae bacterium]|jgi:M3 family oligoendopeptidase|nr:M3 family oligoendopeptidase [Streptococcaceae bacterium]